MFNRRLVLASLAGLSFLTTSAFAQDWKAKYPELVFAIIPAENASGVTERYTPFVNYLSKELGIKVSLRIANDYAAIIEGQRSGSIHIASYGPASFARAVTAGVKVEPFAIETGIDGSKGYHSVLWVKKDASYQKIEDLKGKNLCLVDPNSTSGNNVPRFAMNKLGIDPDKFFGKVVYAGSHENAVIGVQQGTCDAAFNWWNDEQESNLLRMDRKKMVKAEDFRMIFKSEQIVNSPIAYLAALPADLKKSIRDAVYNVHTRDKAAFDKIYEGKQGPLVPVDVEAYKPVIELIKFVDTLRKKSGS
ncbi:phosphate-import protein PhnD precursor [Variibacter gotjawalensis]|uniref:Phosphate-import protein PhnD n=1 Tax=Variibacter gotjawalensis TaxID=1333996 RepID=A0A0S3PT10_9BRAD|nr:phosphonate ABC transporter substrate-binding protein [Variibacter gotjawalensis]NIK49424.1 phosphonate transport system substrate-binding protein [Variibacter gotjawalensis]RZS51276.1 phosphonate transport system substrate-binding protein [Variibacter gotjawalensis]BAT59109.1 phosphate-import protein PhnD precursor [Variibacter gotjawalensis]